jgi:2-methylisocitrate lyase-like PEP mutase family enzyme
MPGAYDSLTARIVERLGFQAVQCSGYSMALSAGSPSESAYGFDPNLAATAAIAGAASIPVAAVLIVIANRRTWFV